MNIPRTKLAAAASLTTLMIGALLTSGCGSSQAAPATRGLEKTHLVVAVPPIAPDAAIWVAAARGLFGKAGLTVTVKPVAQSTVAYPALRHGDVDMIAGVSYVPLIQGLVRNTLNFRVVAEGATVTPNLNAVLVMPGSPIRSAADLPGRKVAVVALENSQQVALSAILAAQNIDFHKVRFVAVPAAEMEAALQRHQVDAVDGTEPFITDAQQRLGARTVVDAGGPPVTGSPLVGYVTTATWISHNPRAALAFQTAIFQAAALMKADPPVAVAAIQAHTGVTRQVAELQTLPDYPVGSSIARMTRIVDYMLQQGLITRSVDPRSFMFHPVS